MQEGAASSGGYPIGFAAASRDSRSNVVDLRSDTVTRPSERMRKAMAEAEVGDDVFGDDFTVKKLEERVANMLGFEAAVFVPSGTQSNLSAVLSHCGRGEEFIAGASYHVYGWEAGGAATLGGVVPCPLQTGPNGQLSPEAVEAAIKPDDPHFPVSRLVCLENTTAGRVVPLENQRAVIQVARRHGLSVHLDGARMMNAAVALGVAPREVATGADTVSLCLSKGLGAPAGSVLSGSSDLIARARRWRKMLGGGMRQVGVLATCGLVALEDNVERLAEDHANARLLAEGLAGLPGIDVNLDAVETNMVFVGMDGQVAEGLRAHLAHEGIVIGAPAKGAHATLRLVTHRDVERADIERVLGSFRKYLEGAA
jgi:threonine aldolase